MKLASIDVGLKRIGVAICLDGNIVMPQDAILRKNRNQAARDINTFLTEWEIEKLIVGLPLDADNSEEKSTFLKPMRLPFFEVFFCNHPTQFYHLIRPVKLIKTTGIIGYTNDNIR